MTQTGQWRGTPGHIVGLALMVCAAVAPGAYGAAKDACNLELPGRLDAALDAEREKELASGEIHVIDDVFDRERPRAVAVAVMNCPVEKVWEFLKNFEEHPKWAPYLQEVERYKQEDGENFYKHVYKPEGYDAYTLHFRETLCEDPRLIAWRLDPEKEDALEHAVATWHVRPFGQQQTLVAFRGAGEVDVPLPNFMLDYFLGGALEDMLEALRNELVPEEKQLEGQKEANGSRSIGPG